MALRGVLNDEGIGLFDAYRDNSTRNKNKKEGSARDSSEKKGEQTRSGTNIRSSLNRSLFNEPVVK
jgi:hypothetical protein